MIEDGTETILETGQFSLEPCPNCQHGGVQFSGTFLAFLQLSLVTTSTQHPHLSGCRGNVCNAAVHSEVTKQQSSKFNGCAVQTPQSDLGHSFTPSILRQQWILFPIEQHIQSSSRSQKQHLPERDTFTPRPPDGRDKLSTVLGADRKWGRVAGGSRPPHEFTFHSDLGLFYVHGTKLCQVIQWDGSVKTCRSLFENSSDGFR